VTHALRPPAGPRTVVLVVGGPIARGALPALREQVRRLLTTRRADLVTCDVAALAPADATAIDALARLQLTARRLGGAIRLRDAPDGLRDLLTLAGLGDALPLCAGLRAQLPRQVEQREQVRVHEEVDPTDSTL
jgi:ABC-type transporter Mla MlaB component